MHVEKLSKPHGVSTRISTLTFDRTAIEAYEFPKFIPTTLGRNNTSIGASALPLGIEVSVMSFECLGPTGEWEIEDKYENLQRHIFR